VNFPVRSFRHILRSVEEHRAKFCEPGSGDLGGSPCPWRLGLILVKHSSYRSLITYVEALSTSKYEKNDVIVLASKAYFVTLMKQES
jgi:hypothetical protein